MANRKRNNQVFIRLSDDENKELDRKLEKSKLSQTEFFVKCINEKDIIVIEDMKEILSELRRIGTNINQISKNLNSNIYEELHEPFLKVTNEFSEINDKILSIMEEIK